MGLSLARFIEGGTAGALAGEREGQRRLELGRAEERVERGLDFQEAAGGRAERGLALQESAENRLQQKLEFERGQAEAFAEARAALKYIELVKKGVPPEIAERNVQAMSPTFEGKDIVINGNQAEVDFGDGITLSGDLDKVIQIFQAVEATNGDAGGVLTAIGQTIDKLGDTSGLKIVQKKTKDASDRPITVPLGSRLVTPTGEVLLGADKSATGAPKNAQNFLLPDKTVVISFDGGRTFKDETGKSQPMPFGAVKISTAITGSELNAIKAREQARIEGEEAPTPPTSPVGERTAEQIAEGGTGPFAALAAAADAVLGGVLAIDKIFGKKGLFPETTENRQALRLFRQRGRQALRDGSRPGKWNDQELNRLFPDPDKFFTNPRTEAKKFNLLREELRREIEFNRQAIEASTTPKETSDLTKANTEVKGLLDLIGPSAAATTQAIPTITNQAEFDALPSGTVFIENGNRFRKP